jgi:hypothetical protein
MQAAPAWGSFEGNEAILGLLSGECLARARIDPFIHWIIDSFSALTK